MALKILTQIGTDHGITSEAYVRIISYNIYKHGSAEFKLQIFLSQENAQSVSVGLFLPMFGHGVSNLEIGQTLNVPLLKEETQVETVVTPTGETVTTTKLVQVPDLTALESTNIFSFGYTKLKEHLVALYGADNIIDC